MLLTIQKKSKYWLKPPKDFQLPQRVTEQAIECKRRRERTLTLIISVWVHNENHFNYTSKRCFSQFEGRMLNVLQVFSVVEVKDPMCKKRSFYHEQLITTLFFLADCYLE